MMPPDLIELRGLEAHGHHGVLAHEQRDGQRFTVDVVLEADLAVAAASDDLADTVDYGALGEAVVQAVRSTRFDLIEALAGHLADLVLAESGVTAVTIRVAKPEAPLSVPFVEVAVTLRRERGPEVA